MFQTSEMNHKSSSVTSKNVYLQIHTWLNPVVGVYTIVQGVPNDRKVAEEKKKKEEEYQWLRITFCILRIGSKLMFTCLSVWFLWVSVEFPLLYGPWKSIRKLARYFENTIYYWLTILVKKKKYYIQHAMDKQLYRNHLQSILQHLKK